MTAQLEIISQGDPFSLLLLIATLWLVGARMAESNPAVLQWGWRLAAGAFVAYAVHGGITQGPFAPEDWVHIVFRGLLAASLTLGLSWILLSVAVFLLGAVRSLLQARVRAAQVRAQRRGEQGQVTFSDENRCHQAQHEADRRAEQLREAAAQAEAKRRRADARATAALTYSLLAPKLHRVFNQQMFDSFVAQFMSENQSPEDVERRGEELLRTLQKHLAESEPPEEKRTLEDLARWFLDEKARIEALPIEGKVKRLHTVELTRRYGELASRLLEKLQP